MLLFKRIQMYINACCTFQTFFLCKLLGLHRMSWAHIHHTFFHVQLCTFCHDLSAFCCSLSIALCISKRLDLRTGQGINTSVLFLDCYQSLGSWAWVVFVLNHLYYQILHLERSACNILSDVVWSYNWTFLLSSLNVS